MPSPRVFRFEVTAVHKYNFQMSRKIVCEARKCQILARFFHHQHFDGFTARHKFETELRHERLLQSLRIGMLPILFIPFEINVELAGEAGSANDWNLKVRFQITSQSAKRMVHANELPGCKT